MSRINNVDISRKQLNSGKINSNIHKLRSKNVTEDFNTLNVKNGLRKSPKGFLNVRFYGGGPQIPPTFIGFIPLQTPW